MDLVVGRVYRRSELHRAFGGQAQSGVSTPRSFPIVLLFTGDSGHKYGYEDKFQEDGSFWYTGEGRRGDMQMRGGNRAIRDHLQSGKTLHLFDEERRSYVRYIGEGTYLGHHTEQRFDLDGHLRTAIVFELAIDATGQGDPIKPEEGPRRDPDARFHKMSLEDLRKMALRTSTNEAPLEARRANVRLRSKAVRAYVLRRANGVCEGCNNPAPFDRPNDQPYLEPHHIYRVADSGPDHPSSVAALCPNCHRRIHHGKDGAAFNQTLAVRISSREER